VTDVLLQVDALVVGPEAERLMEVLSSLLPHSTTVGHAKARGVLASSVRFAVCMTCVCTPTRTRGR
jgi:hypothetical protein